jgi:hydroxymethylbilane synthase
VPVGVNTQLSPNRLLTITGTVTAITGEVHVEHTLTEQVGSAEEAERVGQQLAKVVMEKGARTILEEVAQDRASRGAESANKTAAEVAKVEGSELKV